ncbi:MAG: alpha-galactosidase [Lentisphaeria bacterium]|nr:alpha-galactosidase [Lentisphaeria bacterium]
MKKINELLSAWGCGTLEIQPFFVTKEGKVFPSQTAAVPGNGTLHISVTYPGGEKDDLYFLTDARNEITCRRVFRNKDAAQDICELGMELKGVSFGSAPREDYFYHNENPRIYEKMGIPVDFDRVNNSNVKDFGFDEMAGNRWADPGVVHERIGRSPYQPFPAVLVSNYNSEKGIVHGTLSQKVFFHNYLVSHENETLTLEIFSGFKDIAFMSCPSGKNLVDEWYLGVTEQAADLERVFANYTAVLEKRLPPLYGSTDINRKWMVWGSWNDGISRKISEEMLLKEARFLKENFPTVRWIQVDDGYAVHVPPAHGLGMPYEGEAGVDHKKFPRGLRAYTDEIRRIGLRPAVWIGGFCPKHAPIYQEHPEWFINYDYRTTGSAPLDVSQEEVREYIRHALDIFFYEYGFEGMKHDFWSYAFEDSHDLLKNKDRSGYEYRTWWLQEIRKRIPGDGYLQTGCDIVMGNPFLAEYFTNYRYGIDIGNGNWDYVKTNFLWGAACFATHTAHLFVPNSDSVGLFPGLNDTEAMFCLNYCLATHSMVEIAGKLSESAPDNPRLKTLKKAVCNPNNGQEVFLGGYNYRDRENLIPRIIYFKTPHFSVEENNSLMPLRTAGLFNIEENSIKVTFSAETFGLPAGNYLVTDVWSGETVALEDSFTVEIEPHGSRLYAISSAEDALLLDANMRINSFDGNSAEFDYAGDAELLLTRAPEKLFFEGKELPFERRKAVYGELVSFNVPGKGCVTFK